MNLDAVETLALALAPEERARLIERLIASLDVDPAVDEAWAAEVARRNAMIERGEVALLPGSETVAELKAKYR